MLVGSSVVVPRVLVVSTLRQELTEERIRAVHYLRACLRHDVLAMAATDPEDSARAYTGLLTAAVGILRLIEDPDLVLDTLLAVSLQDDPGGLP